MNHNLKRSNKNIIKDPLLESKWEAIQDTAIKMFKNSFEERPTCDEILIQFNAWNITKNETKESKNFEKNLNQMKQFSNSFSIFISMRNLMGQLKACNV